MSGYREDSFLPIQRVALALGQARNRLTAELDSALAGTGVSGSHIGALLLLSLGVARTSVEVSKLLGIDPGFMTRVVDRLERQGLVGRTRDCLDRRVVNLTLTEAGRNLATQIAEIVPAVLNQRLSSFTPHEFRALQMLLGKLLEE